MKVIVFLADGFEEVEALTVVDYLRRSEIIVEMVSINDNYHVIGSHKIEVVANTLIKDLDINLFDGIVIPGGMPGASNLRDNKQVIEIVKTMNKDKKLVAAICAGPIVLDKAEILTGKSITSYPGFEKELKGVNYKEDKVVRDDNIITARGPYFAVDFAIEIVRYLLSDKEVVKLKSDILFNK